MPFSSEHACSLHPSSEYQQGTFVSMERKHEGKTYRVNMAKKKGEDALSDQSYRYPKDTWTAAQARSHCTSHDGQEFVPASERGNVMKPIVNFSHNSNTSDSEPAWGQVDKSSLPRMAFADQGEADMKSSWSFPHHWVENGGNKNDMGCYTTGTMYLSKSGLNAAWSAAQGGRSGQEASPAVKSHLEAHRRALGLDTQNQGQMPMPKPQEGKQAFMSRCMDEMQQDMPDEAERQAACEMQWQEEGMMENRARWYQIRNAQAEMAEILIYDEIGASFFGEGVEAKKFVEDLRQISAKQINLRINSPGGSVFDGFAIYNALRRQPARIVVDIDGMALSIASVIALAGHEIRMAKNALYMVHDPAGMVLGTAEDMRQMAATLDKVKDSIIGVYQDRTMKPTAYLQGLMSAETWFSAEEARAAGFVDLVTAERQVTAHFDLSRYKHPPRGTVGTLSQPLTSLVRPALAARRDDSAALSQMAQQARLRRQRNGR